VGASASIGFDVVVYSRNTQCFRGHASVRFRIFRQPYRNIRANSIRASINSTIGHRAISTPAEGLSEKFWTGLLCWSGCALPDLSLQQTLRLH